MARLDNVVELIAHEVEHVIEQLDGSDLAGGAAMAGSGIYSVSANSLAFETVRAMYQKSKASQRRAEAKSENGRSVASRLR